MVGSVRDLSHQIWFGEDHVGPTAVDVVFEQHFGRALIAIHDDSVDFGSVGGKRFLIIIDGCHAVSINPDGDRCVAVLSVTGGTTATCGETHDNHGKE